MALRSAGGHPEACSRFLIPTSPRTCMNGPARLSKQTGMSIMRSPIGREIVKHQMSKVNNRPLTLNLRHQDLPVVITSNTGAVVPTSLSARAPMDMPGWPARTQRDAGTGVPGRRLPAASPQSGRGRRATESLIPRFQTWTGAAPPMPCAHAPRLAHRPALPPARP